MRIGKESLQGGLQREIGPVESVTKVGVWVDSGSGDSSSQSLRQWILQLIPTLLGQVLITGSGCLCESRAGP